MKRFIVALSFVVGAWTLSPTPEAQGRSWSGWNNSHKSSKRPKQWNGHGGRRSAVPELDPSAAGSAVVLLLGGIALIASRRREDEQA